MKSNFRSPFKPKFIKDYKPQNLKIRTFNAGFKKKKDDLMILVFEKTVHVIIDNLDPKYISIEHKILYGENFNNILEKYEIPQNEISTIKKISKTKHVKKINM